VVAVDVQRRKELFDYSEDGRTAILKPAKGSDHQDVAGGVESGPQNANFKRSGSFRKQREVGMESDETGVDYGSNRTVADVLKLAQYVRNAVGRLHSWHGFTGALPRTGNGSLSAMRKRKAW
jgi:hypothetical protein